MAVCPFHDDHNPSMKVDDNFYCFGCGATGDVITFTSRFFGISPASAARKLTMDFGISPEEEAEYPMLPKSRAQLEFETWVHEALKILRAYNQLLYEWKSLAPQHPGEDFHFLFVEALQNSTRVKYLLCTLAFGTEDEKRDIYLTCREEVKQYHEKVKAYDQITGLEAFETE
ncbi:MAG: DNA primase [Bacteroides sp.]|nr:DNA primase [Bacteroides sp.]